MGFAASQFDVIIYGASFNGVIAAALLAERGKSVLLLNPYGFAGGSITENLNCIQNFDPSILSPKVKKIFELLTEEERGFRDNGLMEYYLNPESVKLALQYFISQMKIEVLFHVIAYKVGSLHDESITIEIAAKEGSLSLCCRLLIDATDNSHIGLISGMYIPKHIKVLFNIIAAGRKVDEAVRELRPKKYFKISDQRYWISFSVSSAEGFSADSEDQIAEGLNEILLKYNSRIQLLPVVSQRINVLQRNSNISNHGSIIILDPALGECKSPEDVITRASLLENETLNSIIPNK